MEIQSFNFDEIGKSQEDVFGASKANGYGDDRFYKLKRDENGNGAAIIRFLPDPNMKLLQQLYKINVNTQKGAERRWYSALSPQNINLPDPFHKRWAELWRAGKKDEARQFARQTRFYTNIYVVKDPATPENEGKVFLFDISQSLKTILEGLMFPSEADKALGVEPKPLFNPLNGYNFKLVSRKGANGFINYDSSTVVPEASAIFTNKEEAVEAIKNKCYALEEFLQEEAYPTYAELEEKLKYVTFEDDEAPVAKAQPEVQDATVVQESPKVDIAKQQEQDLDDFLNNI